jgi:hypothetical protein
VFRRARATPARGRPWAGPARRWRTRRRCRNARRSRLGGETAQEQRGGDRPREPALRRVVEIGDARFDHLFVRRMEGQAPDRVGDGEGGPRKRRGELLVIGVEGRDIGAHGHARGPGERRHGDRRSGSSSAPSARASARTRRPSASVLLISIVWPSRAVRMSPGRKALPATAFSTAGISTRSRSGRPLVHDHVRKAQHVGRAAHVLLHQPMDAPGLRFRPPVSKHTPLPTRVRRAAFAPCHVDQARVLVAGPADGVDQRQVRIQKAVTVDAGDVAPCSSARSWTACSRALGPISSAGVLIRSRVSASPVAIRSSRAASRWGRASGGLSARTGSGSAKSGRARTGSPARFRWPLAPSGQASMA